MATKGEHKLRAKQVGSFWRNGNPAIRRIAAKAKSDLPDLTKHPHLLLNGCMNYFNWVDNTPWQEDVIDNFKGRHFSTTRKLVRAYTLEGLCAFVGMSVVKWRNLMNNEETDPDILAILEWASGVIYEQTFTGAAAGMFKENIIMRKLGLADKQEKTGADGGPILTQLDIDQSAAEFTALMLKMAERAEAE